MICTSPPYNNGRDYGPDFDDDRPYEEYLDSLLEPFHLYAKLLRTGGRVVYNVASVVQNKSRDKEGQPYYHLVADDLCRRVQELGLGFRFYDRVIWNKIGANPCENNKWGTFADAKMPILRTRFEYVIIFSFQQFALPEVNGVKSDITAEEYKQWSVNVWEISPVTSSKGGRNPSPAAYNERLVERILKIWTRPGDWVIDPYVGSGTTCAVCKRLGRPYTGIERHAGYASHAKERVGSVKVKKTEVFEQAVNRMVEKLDRINENLHRQNEQNGDLFRRVDRLPELLETLPSMVAGQKEVVEALLVELKSRANRDQQFAEVLAKIPVETARQNELLAQISGRVSAAAESSAEMLEGLGRCNESLSQLDEKTVSQTECLREMTQTFTESDRGLKDLIRRQNKRFLWVFASAVGVCILSGAVLAVVLTSLIQS